MQEQDSMSQERYKKDFKNKLSIELEDELIIRTIISTIKRSNVLAFLKDNLPAKNYISQGLIKIQKLAFDRGKYRR
jgi:hypothetical protein